jgi:hypothetical protein
LIDGRLFAVIAAGWGFTMNWKQEHDLLIVQTMAFARSVNARAPQAGPGLENAAVENAAVENPWLETSPINAPAEAAPRVEPLPVALPSVRHASLREEIRGRVAAFRAHQELIRRDRDQYYQAVLARVRTPMEHGHKTTDNSPLKR